MGRHDRECGRGSGRGVGAGAASDPEDRMARSGGRVGPDQPGDPAGAMGDRARDSVPPGVDVLVAGVTDQASCGWTCATGSPVAGPGGLLRSCADGALGCRFALHVSGGPTLGERTRARPRFRHERRRASRMVGAYRKIAVEPGTAGGPEGAVARPAIGQRVGPDAPGDSRNLRALRWRCVGVDWPGSGRCHGPPRVESLERLLGSARCDGAVVLPSERAKPGWSPVANLD